MERYEEARAKARKNLQIADHMVYITYNVVKEPKLLLSVLENVFLTFTNGMAAVLHFERMYKRIPPFTDNFESKYRMFTRICQKNGIKDPYLLTIREVKDLIVAHRKSSVEFARKDRFVICSDDYRMKTVSVDQIKGYVGKAKVFIQDIERITRVK